MYEFAIVGGGIVGLATAMALTKKYQNARILVLEKEAQWAMHQTGHNSGVIHSGIYYKPGSYKARFAREGSHSMVGFCQEHGIEHEICGKVIVATKTEELPLLDQLYTRGLENELAVKLITSDELKEIEPHVNGLKAIHVPAAGIVNYRQICEKYASIVENCNGDLQLNTKVEKITESSDGVTIDTNRGTFQAKYVINCAGLHSDRVTKAAGIKTDMKIVPFRGEYFQLKPEKSHLVKHLIYPVPNPNFPFLGVHFTRMIDGHVEAGPNAVLSLKREGYRKTDFNLRDMTETLFFQGFWKIAAKYWREGSEEMLRSFSKKAFVRSLQQLIPEITENDLEVAPAGVRAQALSTDGSLIDDFYMINSTRTVHVCNAPSPAATASIQIGMEVAERISKVYPVIGSSKTPFSLV